ncbi:MAG: hypothetical protein Q9160_007616 [Pyrenula sp. 1 TL-2023]
MWRGHHQLPTPLSPSTPVDLATKAQNAVPPLPTTPPEPISPQDYQADSFSVSSAIHVISTQRKAVEHLESIYQSDDRAQASFSRAVSLICSAVESKGKVVIVGVGKSGKVCEKLKATFISLGISSFFLHPTEALHGDLGAIKESDVILMVTFSGKTPELLQLLPYLPNVPIIMMSSCMEHHQSPILAARPGVLLQTPIHEPETVSFGHSAPTSSTTVSMVLGDALALVVAQKLYGSPGRTPADVFLSNHPGGAIGQTQATKSKTIESIAMRLEDIPDVVSRDNLPLVALDVVLTAVRSTCGWARLGQTHVVSTRKIRSIHLMEEPVDLMINKNLAIERSDWISVLGSWSVTETRRWIEKMRSEPRGRTFLKKGTVLGVVDDGKQVSSVLDIEDVPGLQLTDP